MLKHDQEKSIFERKWPSLLGIAALFLAVLMLETMLIARLVYLDVISFHVRTTIVDPSGSRLLFAPLWYLFAFLIALPLAAGVITTFTTTQGVQGEAYELMLVSRLSGREIASGYLLGSFYRLRALWAVALASLPAFSITLGYSDVLRTYLFVCMSNGGDDLCQPPQLADVIDGASFGIIAALLIAVLVMSIVIAAVTTGNLFALQFRRLDAAIALTVTAVLSLITIDAGLIWTLGVLPDSIVGFVLVVPLAAINLIASWQVHQVAARVARQGP